ncbi:hypothetical protein F3Y22_tig00110794pilonHSYRG00087 [Hibiscus syriacus]|uniref:Uncharacterized protein n=1 Tax=Hibiscus syriacus TaxID=106335 RepID=A0A6A2ZP91_HIBSY|nr:hypothetical protein F3Y22_tig00110794pilonHSYRG00087 [Hibiscus syriacus]
MEPRIPESSFCSIKDDKPRTVKWLVAIHPKQKDPFEFIVGHRENLISPETVISEKPNIEHFQSNGAGTGESYWFQESLEEDQEDELTRTITLLALALETFKRKMDSATRKKLIYRHAINMKLVVIFTHLPRSLDQERTWFY